MGLPIFALAPFFARAKRRRPRSSLFAPRKRLLGRLHCWLRQKCRNNVFPLAIFWLFYHNFLLLSFWEYTFSSGYELRIALQGLYITVFDYYSAANIMHPTQPYRNDYCCKDDFKPVLISFGTSMLWVSLDGMWIDAAILYKPLTLPLRHFQFFSQQFFLLSPSTKLFHQVMSERMKNKASHPYIITVDMELWKYFSLEMLLLVTAYRNQNKKVNTLSRLDIIFQSKKWHKQ